MLPRADVTGTRPLGPVDAPAPTSSIADARQESFNRLAQIAIGKQFQAEILSRLNDGTFLVRVADTVARMNLPVTTRAGDSMAMTLVSKEPRPTFLLGQQAGGTAAAQNMAGQLLGQLVQAGPEEGLLYTEGGRTAAEEGVAPSMAGTAAAEEGIPAPAVGKTAQALQAAANAAAAAATPGSAPTSLSTAGRLINSIIQSAQQNEAPAVLAGKTPLVASPAAGAPQLASALKDTLAFSGLFYESHVAQWASGERAMTDLLREPQAGTVLPAQADEAAAPPNAAKNLPLQAGNATQAHADTLPAGISTETAQLINLQLGTLENRRVQWQGELWPGQELEWEVSEDAPDGEAADRTPTWNSAVKFELPNLGVVSAAIRLVGQHVQVQIRTETEDSASALRAHGAELAKALDAAGSPLDLLTVKQDGKT